MAFQGGPPTMERKRGKRGKRLKRRTCGAQASFSPSKMFPHLSTSWEFSPNISAARISDCPTTWKVMKSLGNNSFSVRFAPSFLSETLKRFVELIHRGVRHYVIHLILAVNVSKSTPQLKNDWPNTYGWSCFFPDYEDGGGYVLQPRPNVDLNIGTHTSSSQEPLMW